MVGLYHQLDGHEFEQTPGDSEGQGSLACCKLMGWQRVRHDLAIEQQQIICISFFFQYVCTYIYTQHILFTYK